MITLTLTATSDAPCTDATDQMTITITPAATVSAGADATICETGSYTLAGSAVANATTLLWSTSGTGTFNNISALHPIYTPSAADITAGAVTLTITATPAAPCTAVSDAMVLNINRQATVNAGADATICETGTYTLVMQSLRMQRPYLWATSGTGTFDDATTLNPVYTPSVADITAGSVTLTITASSAAPCSDATDAMVLNINSQATVNAGADATICETAGSYTLAGAAATNATTLLWTTSGSGYFNNATTLNPVYTPSAADIAAGTVTLTITASSAAPCVSASDAMVLDISRQAVVNAGADASICEGSAYTVSGASSTYSTAYLWATSGTGTFDDATTLNPVYTPSVADITAGSVTLTITASSAAPCSDATDAMVLNINGQATVNAGADATICETAGSYTLAGATATNATTLLWTTSGTGNFNNATTLNPVYTPSAADIAAGSVTLTITASSAAPCVSASDAMVLDISRQAVVNAGADATICEGGTYTLVNAVVANATTLLWSHDGLGTLTNDNTLTPTYTPAVGETGVITLTLTATSDAPCTDATDQMTITITPAATVSAGADATICETGSYTLAGSAVANATTLLWSTSGTGSFNNITALHPIYTPSAADIVAGSVTLTITATPAAPCTAVSDAMVLNINRQAVVNAGIDATICENASYTVSTATSSYAASILWTHNGLGTISGAGTMTPTYTPAAGETGVITLTVTATSASPCVDVTDQMTITITPAATVSAGPDATICETGTYTLNGSAVANATSLLWSTSGTGSFNNAAALHAIYIPSAADILNGSVTLTLTAYPSAPCPVISDEMVLTISRQAIVNAGTDASICEGATYTINSATSSYATLITWNHNGLGTLTGGNTLTPTYTPAAGETGVITLTLTATSAGPCVDATDQMTISITPAATVSAGPDATICETGNHTLAGSSSTNAISLLWSTSGTGSFNNAAALNPIYIPSAADILNGSVTLTLSVTPAAPCAIVTDAMVLTISHQAIVNAGTDASICEGSTYTISGAAVANATTLQWTHNGLGTLSGAGTLTPTYTPAAGETGVITLTLTATSTAPCIDATDQMTISITPAATVFAGPDATICETGTYSLANSAVANATTLLWSSSGTGSFNNAAALNPIYIPSAADILNGTVTLTLTATPASPCATASDAMVLTINRQAVVNAGTDATICETSGTYTLSNSSAQFATAYLWSSSGTGSFNDASLLHPIYTPSAADILAGSVTITVTASSTAPCVDATDAMVLNINRQAIVNAGTDATICETGTYSLTTATAQYATSFLWTTTGTGSFNNPTSLNPVYNPSPNDVLDGIVILTLTATSTAPCVSATDEMTLHINRQAIVNAGPDGTICEGSTFTVSGATSLYAASINWSHNGLGTLSGANTITPTYSPAIGETGVITMVLTGTSVTPCLSVTDQMNITINPGAVVNAGADATICETGTYTLLGSTASNYSSLLWTTSGEGMFNNPAGLNPTYIPSASDILNGSVVLTLTVTGIAPCGTISDNMTLYISHQAIANAGPDAALCEGSSFAVTAAAASYQTSISWTHNGAGTITGASTLTPVYTPGIGETGDIILTLSVTSAVPCNPASDQMTLHIYALPAAYAGVDTTICEGSSYAILGSAASNYSSLIWSTSGTGTFNNAGVLHPVYVPSQSDVVNGFVFLVLNAYGNGPCPAATDSMQLFINQATTANAGPDATICQGSMGFTVSGATAQDYTSILWTTNGLGLLNNPNTLSPTYIPQTGETGTITLTLTAYAAAPCPDVVDGMNLTILPAPVASAGIDDSICEGQVFIPNTANAGYYTNLMWTTSGTGYFSNPTALHPTYTPSASDILNESVVLTITATGTAPCTTVSDDMMLIIRRIPVANAGDDAAICQGSDFTVTTAIASNYTGLIWTHNGNGNLVNETTINPTYQTAPGET
ncbi:MAG: hypothetical protein IPH45_12920 [Bacteroidales bacterium]|nr:hypothetical protein [Bacteroidales bacterium]